MGGEEWDGRGRLQIKEEQVQALYIRTYIPIQTPPTMFVSTTGFSSPAWARPGGFSKPGGCSLPLGTRNEPLNDPL